MKKNLLKDTKTLIDNMLQAITPIIKKYFSQNLKIETKKDTSPVTKADKETELLMRKMISKKFPNHGIIGEEYGFFNQDAEYVWVLDPIDGTKSFISGVPLFGTLIALLENKKPFIGVIYLPIFNEVYLGIKGKKTTLNGKPVKIRECKKIQDATLLCTDHLDAIKHISTEKFTNLAHSVKLYRNWGDCYMYTLLAKGKVDIVIDPLMNYWDIQALIPVIEGAGGIITGIKGDPPEKANSMLAASSLMHSEVLKMLNYK